MTNDGNTSFSMRVTVPFRNKITMNAKSLNMSDTDYVKNAIANTKLNYKPMKKDLAKIALAISKLGNNVNQIAYVLNMANKQGALNDIEYDKILDMLLDIKMAVRDVDRGNN